MKRAPLWTDQEKKDLIELVTTRKSHAIDWVAVLARFPTRTKSAVHNMIRELGVTRKNWSEDEDRLLKSLWGQVSPHVLRSRFRGIRKWTSVLWRAQELKLTAGAPQGMVSIYSLSESPKWGYDYWTTVRMFQWAGTKVTHFSYRGKKHTMPCVDEVDALEAAERWGRSERPAEAARRLKVRDCTLRKWLNDGGHRAHIPAKQQFRADPEFYDRVYAKHRGSVPGEKKQQKIHQDRGESATQ